MKSFLTAERIANGLRIYGVMNLGISLLSLLPGIISQFDSSMVTVAGTISGFARIVVASFLEVFLYFGLALALERIVEIGEIIKRMERHKLGKPV